MFGSMWLMLAASTGVVGLLVYRVVMNTRDAYLELGGEWLDDDEDDEDE